MSNNIEQKAEALNSATRKRDERIYKMHMAGKSGKQIQMATGLSLSRIAQIIKRQSRLLSRKPESGALSDLLDTRALNICHRAGIRTIGELRAYDLEVMSGFRGAGKRVMEEIRFILK